MKSIWSRLDAWLAANVPEVAGSLRVGVDQGRLNAAERVLGFPLSPELEEFYRAHDGQEPDAVQPFFRKCQLLPLTDALLQYTEQRERFGEQQGEYLISDWDTYWFPFAMRPDAKEFLCVELGSMVDPKFGQVVLVKIGKKKGHTVPKKRKLAPSLRAWFRDLVDDAAGALLVELAANEELTVLISPELASARFFWVRGPVVGANPLLERLRATVAKARQPAGVVPVFELTDNHGVSADGVPRLVSLFLEACPAGHPLHIVGVKGVSKTTVEVFAPELFEQCVFHEGRESAIAALREAGHGSPLNADDVERLRQALALDEPTD